jgi:hypothetical protein
MIDYTGKDKSWWPDMKGHTVAILASGPSMTRAQCDLVRGTSWTAVAINETWRLAPWAAVLYGCDWEWWAAKAPPSDEFDGLRVIGTVPKVRNKPQFPADMEKQAAQLRYLPVVAGQSHPLWQGPAVGAGSNSAFQVANWVARCGAVRLVLLGVDCHSPNVHWHGGHSHPMAQNQKPTLMNTWLTAWRNAAPQFTERGISVINCSPGSALDCFPRAKLEQIAA